MAPFLRSEPTFTAMGRFPNAMLTNGQAPFHVHGAGRFLVLPRQGVPSPCHRRDGARRRRNRRLPNPGVVERLRA